MLRTSVKKYVQPAWKKFWKRCEGWATEFAYKYQYDIFFRTKTQVVLLVLLLLLLVVGCVVWALQHVFGVALLRQLHLAVPYEQVWLMGGSLVLLVVGLGYTIAYRALKPSREALASQKQFIANIAHELRTPLSVMKTNIEVALMDQALDDAVRGSLLGNVDELNRTADIINNLLSFNTLQNPERIEFGNCDLGKVVTQVTEKLSALAKEKQVVLRVNTGEFAVVWGNVSALEQVAFNVIKNALLFTDSGGSVHVEVVPDYRGHIELRVFDSGIGIAHDVLLHVLEPFYRADSSRTKWQGGSGLGLTIVSELVKLHGGKISIKSKVGEGTMVLIAVPCGHLQEAEMSISDSDGVVARDYSKFKTIRVE